MSTTSKSKLDITLTTTLALISQFEQSLRTPNYTQETSQSPSPLILLKAAATSIKSQTTKLSLLTITNPFTPSAIISCLQPINDSILPSLITATLLTTPKSFTESFSLECLSLTRNLLRDFQILIRLIQLESQKEKKNSIQQEKEKESITEVTGRIWEDCDAVIQLSNEGIPGLILRKTKQWLELMKDAVKELQDWDPDEEVDENDLFGDQHDGDSNGEEEDEEDTNNTKKSNDHATISAGVKEQVLKVLNRIPQAIHVVIKQRLEKELPFLTNDNTKSIPNDQKTKLEMILLKQTRSISEMIDESAEAMYLGNPEQCLKKAGEARALTIDLVQAFLSPISLDEKGKDWEKENGYLKRALEWVQQVDPGGQMK